MNHLSCQICGHEVKETTSYYHGHSEMGFDIQAKIYECPICHTKHIICPECEGDGYSFNDFIGHHDCDVCNGMGVIALVFNNESKKEVENA